MSIGTAGLSTLVRLSLQFDDNQLLAVLCGVRDQHQLGVRRLAGGSVLIIEGLPAATQSAKDILDILWSRLRQGLTVDLQEVDAASRMAGVWPTSEKTSRAW